LADKVYLLPVTVGFVTKVIEKERPDGIMLGFGGQTALNCGIELAKQGILDKYNVQVLGTPISGIEITEDRKLFKKMMMDNGIPVPKSNVAYNMEEALKIARDIGYPVIIRVAYTLGGRGGGVAHNEYELHEIAQRGLAASMVHQILIEEYIGDWKQIEYEVMRDYNGNSVTVCNMENVLGMKVHTGDNIVVAPSQTLNNDEYHMLRTASIQATRACNIVGECNIQFALSPKSEQYYAIEINARLSRSSALASKATGYPLAYMAAKIALGYTLPELINKITKVTTACFEPALDYLVVKFPRWDFKKFEMVNRQIGTQMKSVGEVMAIGRNFEEAIQKAVRMLDIGLDGVTGNGNGLDDVQIEELEDRLLKPNDEIIFTAVDAIRKGISIERISKVSSIDPWFVAKLYNIVELEKKLKQSELNADLIRESKRLGFADKQIAKYVGMDEIKVREFRKQASILPVVKQIDTLAAEWPAKTNYLYMTYGGSVDDVVLEKNGKSRAIVLGAGPYRIGSSVEFDWGTVNMVWGLKDNGVKEVAVINCNPETVSTDYDVCDRLYFEELTQERVLDIYEKERADGVVTCVGGQVANNLTPKLAKSGVRIIGTSHEDVDKAEDRSKFSNLLDQLGIKQPAWQKFTNLDGAKTFSKNVGYPVLVRPSYVLSGAAMKVVWDERQLRQYLTEASNVSPEYPVVISKFMLDSLEVEVDAISDGSKVIIGSMIEHIETAGIHSGDAMMVIPPWRLTRKTVETITDYSSKIAKALKIKGPFNMQYIVKDDNVYVIECNVRASRSMPFVSKFVGLNLIALAARVMTGKSIPKDVEDAWLKTTGFGIKVPQFSFMQLEGADIVLGVEMQSTGEVACFGSSFYDALSKALIAAGYTLPTKGSALVTVGGADMKSKVLPMISILKSMGFNLLATEHTAEFLIENGFRDTNVVYKISEPDRSPNITDLLYSRELDFIVNIPNTSTLEKYVGMLYDEYQIRRKAVEMGLPVLTTLESANSFAKTLEWLRNNEPSISVLKGYIEMNH
jgi:carbamoyl-phosphate synthase large subunit